MIQDSGVLVVDDDVLVLRLCEKILQRAGNSVTITSDPFKALELVKAKAYDLLLVDIMMPQMDGFELVAQVKAIRADMAILVMTGFGTIETAIEALRRGVDGLILKPFENAESLLEAIRQAKIQNQRKQDAGRLYALRPLFIISETLISETNPATLLERIQDSFSALLHTSHIGIYREPVKEKTLISLAHRGKLTGRKGIVKAFFEDRDIFFAKQENEGKAQSLLEKFGLSSTMGLKVSHGFHNLVFFTARHKSLPAFIESDFERFAILARQSAIAIENARLYEDLRLSLKRIEESQIALVQAEKMAAVGRLVASVAHEVNNPLQAVRNCLHLASRDEIAQDQKNIYIDMAQKEMDRLENTVNRMLDFYRPGRIDREEVDIRWLVERVLEFLGAQLRKQEIAIHTRFEDQLPKVYTAREPLQQVILNLILNAIDAVEAADRPKEIWIEIFNDRGMMKFWIEDSGDGVPPENQNNIFEPFFSSKEKGTGLGLTISYDFIKSQGGTLLLVPGRYGYGACFEVGLPYRGKNGRRKNPSS